MKQRGHELSEAEDVLLQVGHTKEATKKMTEMEESGKSRLNEERNPDNLRLRFGFRKLQHVSDEELIRIGYNRTSHRIRHKNKLRKFNERLTERFGFNESDTIAQDVSTKKIPVDYSISKNQSVIYKNVNNTVKYYSEDIVKEKVDIHEHCYTTNEVLEIIAATCLVNFIFWFLILTCVNFYTKKEKIKYTSWESLESAGVASEYEMKYQQGKGHLHLRRSFCGDDYTDDELESNYLVQHGDILNEKKSGKVEYYQESTSHDDDRVKWAIFHDESSLRKNRRKSHVASSLSMENLIF